MAAGSPPHYSVGTGYHIDIKVQIDLKRSKDHIVQTVDVSALIHRVSVFGCGYSKCPGSFSTDFTEAASKHWASTILRTKALF